MKVRCSHGQTLLEYVLALACLLGLFAAVGVVVTAAKAKSARTVELVRGEYP